MSKGLRAMWVNIDMVEASPAIREMVEAARGIISEPHGFRAKLVKSAAVFLADLERARHATVTVTEKREKPGLDLDDFLKWQGYKTDGFGNVVE